MHSENVAKGAVYLVIQNIFVFFFSFIFYALIARVLGPAEVGKLSVLLMISAFFMISNLSLNFALQKYIPTFIETGRQNETGSIIKEGLVILIPISVIIVSILLLFSTQISIFVFGSTSETWPIIIILLSSFVLNFTLFFGGAMLGFGLFKETAIQNIMNTGLSRTLAISLAVMGLGLVGVAISWLIAAVVTLLFSLFVLRRNLHFTGGFSKKNMIKFSLPVHIFVIIMFIQGWVDIAVLYALSTDISEIGTYYLVISGVMVLSVFYIPISMVILPALSSRYSQNGFNGLSPIANTYIRLVSKILIPVGFSFAALSTTAIEVAFGSQYISGSIPFSMLATTIFVQALAILMVTIIQSIGNTKPLIIMGVSSAIADITIVAVFADSLGGIAGASGRIAFSIISVIFGYYFIRKNVKLQILSPFKQSIIAATIIAIPLYVLDQYLIHTINLTLRLRAPIDILAFISLAVTFIYLTNYITKEEFEILRQSMPKKLEKIISKIENIFIKSNLKDQND